MIDISGMIAAIVLGYVDLPPEVKLSKQRPVIGFDIKAERIAELHLGSDGVVAQLSSWPIHIETPCG